MNLSKRLKTIASFIPEGSFFADIGTDHAYLPCYVCLQDDKARAIAGDVTEGPYQSAKETVQQYDLEKEISVRLGNGLEVIQGEPVEVIVIAGMGGQLITEILTSGKDQLSTVKTIIAQPNTSEYIVRKWLLANHYTLTDEVILEENGHIYEVLVATKGDDKINYEESLIEQQLLFGPKLMAEKPAIFKQKWLQQLRKINNIIDSIEQADNKDQYKQKLIRLKQKINWIEEVIK